MTDRWIMSAGVDRRPLWLSSWHFAETIVFNAPHPVRRPGPQTQGRTIERRHHGLRAGVCGPIAQYDHLHQRGAGDGSGAAYLPCLKNM